MTLASANTASEQSFTRLLRGNVADRILLLSVLAAIFLAWTVMRDTAGGPLMVEIHHGNTLLANYPLHQDVPVHFEAEGDIGISEIVIDSHGVHFASSPCPGQQCVHSGNKTENGDLVACVPNRILVSIRGDLHGSTGFDAVSQ